MGEKTSLQGKVRNSNIDILRLIAAAFVMAGHMAYIGGGKVPMVMSTQIHAIGVYMLFSISGALIVRSWCSDPNLVRYAIKRIFRILPPLIVFSLLMVFVAGPLLSAYPTSVYFQKKETYDYLKNILLFPVYALLGVFQEVPYTGVVNGSLWTIPIEVAMYCAIPVIITLTGFKRNSTHLNPFLVIFVVGICAFDLRIQVMPERPHAVFYGTDWLQALDVIPFYCIGMLFASSAMERFLSMKIALVAVAIALCLSPSAVGYRILLYFLIPYCCFSFAHSKPVFAEKKHEVSYGIYLYGFFIQQLVVCVSTKLLRYNLSQDLYFVITMMITGGCAILSERYIEKPALRLCRRICERI